MTVEGNSMEAAAIEHRPDMPVKLNGLDPDAARLKKTRQQLQRSFGQVVLSMTRLPRYRHHAIGDLTQLVLDPLARNRIAIAEPKEASGEALGFAIWASVSEEVDEKVKEQVRAEVFPLRLVGDEWASGEIIWLLDIIAPTNELTNRVLLAFGAIAKDQAVRMHPAVKRLVDPALLERLKVSNG